MYVSHLHFVSSAADLARLIPRSYLPAVRSVPYIPVLYVYNCSRSVVRLRDIIILAYTALSSIMMYTCIVHVRVIYIPGRLPGIYIRR